MAEYTVHDPAIKAILKKILQAFHVRDWGYYEDFEIRGYITEAKKVRMTLAVLVPENERLMLRRIYTNR